MTGRKAVFDELAALIVNASSGRRLRVAIDGRTASGKTILADELAAAIQAKGRPAIRTSIDGFHRPKIERYARGRYSAEGYYYDARDLDAVRTMLLDPLAPTGNGLYRTVSFDLDADKPIEQEPQLAPADAVLVVDGTFLQRPELRDGWDLTIFVATSEAVAAQRGVSRDADRLGGEEAAQKLFAQRYRPAFHLYDRLCSPAQSADVIVNNNDFSFPALQLREQGMLATQGVAWLAALIKGGIGR